MKTPRRLLEYPNVLVLAAIATAIVWVLERVVAW